LTTFTTPTKKNTTTNFGEEACSKTIIRTRGRKIKPLLSNFMSPNSVKILLNDLVISFNPRFRYPPTIWLIHRTQDAASRKIGNLFQTLYSDNFTYMVLLMVWSIAKAIYLVRLLPQGF